MEPILYGSTAAGYRVRQQLEAAFAQTVQQEHACAIHSGTVGLFVALLACGIGAGDEVITVGNSDISTTAAISQIGAKPIICDILATDYTIDISLVESLITSKTRAILPVDLYGHPANVKQLRGIADQHGLMIVEDAALATGAQDSGVPVGAFADVAVFSFAAYKPLGCAGNGAMMVTSNPEIARRLRLLTGYGHDPDQQDVPAGHQRYLAEGFNVPLDPLQAAIVLVKLPYLAATTARRQAVAKIYEQGLADSPVVTPSFRAESVPTFRSYTILVPRRASVHQQMLAAGIEVAIHYAPPQYHHPVYGGQLADPAKLPVTEKVAADLLCLPVSPEVSDEEAAFVVETLRGCLDG
ncbi:MAG: DegT/DnrJ/EryC1/StrS family aminotransferase [Chloroflexota bacterium]